MRIWLGIKDGLGSILCTAKSDLVCILAKAKVNAVTYVETVMESYDRRNMGKNQQYSCITRDFI